MFFENENLRAALKSGKNDRIIVFEARDRTLRKVSANVPFTVIIFM